MSRSIPFRPVTLAPVTACLCVLVFAHAPTSLAQGKGAATSPALPASASSQEAIAYDDYFTSEAMRVDLMQQGTAKGSQFALDEVVWEPVWPGTRRYLIDPFGYGTYRFRVVDQASSKEIFRLGYSSLFDEWTSTPEAISGMSRSMSQSVRFPWPKKSVQLHIDKRHKDGSFKQIYSVSIDPNGHGVNRTRKFNGTEVVDLVSGPPLPRALDIVFVPEGYRREDEGKLRADFARFASALASAEPFRSHKQKLSIRGVLAFSHDSGVTEPRKGYFPDTLLGATFNTFDSPRYLTLPQTKTLRQVASVAPYDAIIVIVNSSRYGGGGIYNQWALFTSDNEYDDYVMVHEFGHSLAGLADEYYDSQIAMDDDTIYPKGVEPWEPNITAFLGKDPKRIKWHAMIDPSTPIPTLTYENAKAASSAAESGIANDKFKEVVGLFEGAGYKARGLYRSQQDCKMFHKGLVPFCAVCSKSIEKMIRYYAGEDGVL